MRVRKVRWVLAVGVSALACAAMLLSGCARFDGVVDFTADPTSGKKPLSVSFTPQVQGNVQGWIWSFGDGQTSTERSPEHTYTEAGAYTVILMIIPSRGEPASVMKEDFITVRSGLGSVPATLVVQDDEFDVGGPNSVPSVTHPWLGTVYVLDVSANDTPGAGAYGLTIVGVRASWSDAHDSATTETDSGVAMISSDGKTIEYAPLGSPYSDSFYYLVTDGQTTAEGEVRVNLYDPIGHP